MLPNPNFPQVLGPNPSSGPPFLLPAVQRACCHSHQRLSLAHLHQPPWSKPSATAGPAGCQPARGSPSFHSCPAAPFLPGAPCSPPGPLRSASRNHDTLGWKLGAPITLAITSKRLHRPARPFTINLSSSPVSPGARCESTGGQTLLPRGPSAFILPDTLLQISAQLLLLQDSRLSPCHVRELPQVFFTTPPHSIAL